MNDTDRNYVVVNQIDTNESDVLRVRSSLKREFSKFGTITKLYVDEGLRYAKVYFDSFEICDGAVKQLRRNPFGWKVSHKFDQDSINQNFRIQNTFVPNKFGPNRENNNSFRKKPFSAENFKMDNYLDEEFSENCDYCNVHGQPLSVLQADSGDFYVNLKDIRKTGFAIFRLDTFDSILVDRQQIHKEFDLHLLSEAKNYILKNRVTCIDEDQILQTIERCKNRLLNNQRPFTRTVPNTARSDQKSDFPENRNRRTPSDFSLRSEIPPHTRPPKTLPESFMPSNSYVKDLSQNRRNNENYREPRGYNNGFNKGDSNGWDMNKSDYTKNEFRRTDKGNFRDSNRHETNRGDFNKRDFNNDFDSTGESSKSAATFSSIENNQSYRKHDQSRPRTNATIQSETQKEILEIGTTYNVKVCYCDPNKDNIVWVQKVESSDLCDKMLLDISEMEPNAEVIANPSEGQLVLGEFEGIWFRAEVVNSKQKLLHFIDYGNQSVVDLMKIIPEKLKKIPALAIRMVISQKTGKLNEDDELSVTIAKEYDDGTFLANLTTKEEVIENSPEVETATEISKLSPTQNEVSENVEQSRQRKISQPDNSKGYILSPASLTTLKEGDKIMFSEQIGNKFAVKTKECVDKSKELNAYIKELDKSALVMTSVTEGQLVLCSKEGHVGLCRAVVEEVKQGNVVSIKYVDYPGEDVLTLKSLRNVDNFLAKQPSALLMTPEIWYMNDLNISATNFITQLVGRKEKAVVVMSKKGMDFRLETNQLLSEVITEKLSSASSKSDPPQQSIVEEAKTKEADPVTSKTETVKKLDEKVLFDDMAWITLEPGEYDFICYHLKGVDDITLVSTLDEHVKYMEEVVDISDPDNTPYKPEVLEMCLVFYMEETEGFWYRGFVADVDGNDYSVLMVDFGNLTTVQSDKLRKFPQNLKRIPILGVPCEFSGIPNTPQVTAKLKELIPDNKNFKAIIKKYNEDICKYIIDIPEVREQVKKAGFC